MKTNFPLSVSVLLLFIVAPLAPAQGTVETDAGAPANKSSVEFDLDRAANGVTKVEEKIGGTWTDKTSDYCVKNAQGSKPEVRKKSGDITVGRKIRITTGAWPNKDGPDVWDDNKCEDPEEI